MPLHQVNRVLFGKLRRSFPVFAPVIFILPLLVSATATANSLYQVDDVSLDATAETASAAKTIALATGRQKAFSGLLDRLTLDRDRKRRPVPNNTQLDGLITAIDITGEKTSQTRYLGRLNVTFDRAAVRTYLSRQGLPLSETPARPALIIPVLSQQTGRDIWSPGNMWREALAREEEITRLMPISLPVGDLEDMNIMPLDIALNSPTERMAILQRRYDASSVLVVNAAVKGNDPAAPTGLVIDYEQKEAAGLARKRINVPIAQQGETLESLLMRGAAQFARRLDEDWKSRNLLNLARKGRITAIVRFTNFNDWLTIQRRLEGVSVLKRHDIDSLRRTEARIVLTHYGGPNQVITALAQSNLRLEQKDGYWTLSLR